MVLQGGPGVHQVCVQLRLLTASVNNFVFQLDQGFHLIRCLDHEVIARKPQVFRDYQSEAEEDLFGPNGMLSHYSDIPSDTVAIVASASETTRSIMSSTVPTIATTTKKQRITKTPNHALLPFKEIGKRMQFSGEYCRRTCSIALNKLTLAAEDGRLAESDFLLGF